ncbi:MFS transporter [Bacillus pseudomycoides]|uniref:MFS transporter n=1 Tax=Bacillus pseudomycoides TaxID=64104 RepID=UPI000BED1926|nr:MFS transporter [Bacillus pseudomycoides]PDZ70800.1 MFS transporter [Bacillus pseudomycoides]
MKIVKQYSGLSKPVYMFIIAEFINNTGNFVIPFLTMFLTLSLDLTASEAGIWMMFVSLLYIPGSLIGGKLADSLNRKKIILFTLSLKAALLIICAFVGFNYFLVCLLMLSMFVGSLASPSFRSLLAENTTLENRRAAYSLLYLTINLAMSISPLMAGLLFNKYMHLLFLGDAITLLLAFILYWIYIPGEYAKNSGGNKKSAKEDTAFSFIARNPAILILLTSLFIYNFIYSQHSFSLPIQINDSFTDGPKIFGLLMSVNALTVLLLTPIITYFTKKIKVTLNMLFAGLFLGFGFGLIYFAQNSVVLFLISTIMWTIGEILIATNSEVYIINSTSENIRGRIFGLLSTIKSIGMITGPLATGLYIELLGIKLVWPLILFLGICLSLSILYMNLVIKKQLKTQQSPSATGV